MKRQTAAAIVFVLALYSGLRLSAQSPAGSTVDVGSEDLLTRPVSENWSSYNGDYTGRRFSALREITRANVSQLRAAWVFHPGNSQRLEATPVVVRGVMYLTSANDVFALDARTGRTLWHYARALSSGLLDDAAAHKSRGVAVWGHFVYSETDDAHLLCLDARSGNLIWNIQYADKVKHYGGTSAPLVVKDMVIVGTSGGDSGVRGFLAAYDAKLGPSDGDCGRFLLPGNSAPTVGPEIPTCMEVRPPGCRALTIQSSIPCTGRPATPRQILMEMRGPETICIRRPCLPLMRIAEN